MHDNLPPGVSEGMIPGNRPEDLEEEKFWDELDIRFSKEFPKEAQILLDMFEGDNGLDDILMPYVLMARDIGYDKGFNEAARQWGGVDEKETENS